MGHPELPQDGSCRCGQILLRIESAPLLTMACHCTGCQRMSASAYSLSAAIPTEGFGIARGEPAIGGIHGATRHFHCPHCMSWMFTRPAGFDAFVNVRPTMFDAAVWSNPFIETMTREKLPWVTTPAIHSFESWPAVDQFEDLIKDYATRLLNG
jgi:hypothetical protein